MGSEWHPIFLTTEISPGVWVMQHAIDYGPFGKIELRRVSGGEARYKVMLRGDLIGWAMSLQVACERLYAARIADDERLRRGPPNGR